MRLTLAPVGTLMSEVAVEVLPAERRAQDDHRATLFDKR